MIAVLFEAEPHRGAADRCFEVAAAPGAELEPLDGFVSLERFESLAGPGRFLSSRFWRDEARVRTWRCPGTHRRARQAGGSGVRAGCRLRGATLVRDPGMQEREQAPSGSRSALP